MSRYAFIAAATMFTGLLFVLTMAIAQRDARVSRTLPEVEGSAYAAVLAKPIMVDSDAIGPDGGVAPSLPLNGVLPNAMPVQAQWVGDESMVKSDSMSEPEPVSAWGNGIPIESSDPQIALVSGESPTAADVEPPKFDASRIVAPRPRSEAPPTLLPPGGSPMSAPPAISLPTLPDAPSSLPTSQPALPNTASPQSGVAGLNAPTLQSLPAGTAPTTNLAIPDLPNQSPIAELTSPPVTPNEISGSNTRGVEPPTAPIPLGGAPRVEFSSPIAAPVPSLAPALPTAAPTSLPSGPMIPTTTNPSVATPGAALLPRTEEVGIGASSPMSSGRRVGEPSDPPSLTGRGAAGWSMATPTPGSRQFDGSQNPSLEIHKRAPEEVQVGVAATFTAIVRNVGNSTAFDVQVTDAIPKGARLVRTFPEAQRVGNDGLSWSLGELAAGQEATISMEIVPEAEGELGSVASVKFAAQASVRTISTQPRLSIKQTAVAEMLGGDSATIYIDVSNIGTGVARDVRLEEDVPSVFRHISGASALQQDVGDLSPGESMRFEIELMALVAGKVSNVVRATSSNSATAESTYPIEVKAPKLQLQLVGPKLRHLERPAPYEAIIENIGTASARDLYITTRLPRGMNFISASNEGTYMPDQHSVVWNLMELAAGTKAKAELVLLPVEEGRYSIAMTTDAEGVRAEPTERDVVVEGQSELTFEIDDDNDPIEVAGMTTYSVRIKNIGTRPDSEIRLVVEAPEGTLIDQVSSPMKYQVSGRQVVFASIPSLASKQEIVVKVGVKHSREGTQVLRASLQSQLRAVPVIKEESTQVYRDQ